MRIKEFTLAAWALLAIGASDAPAFNQVVFSQQLRRPNINKVINAHGWQIPGLAQCAVATARRLRRRLAPHSVPVYVTELKPRKDARIETYANYYFLMDDIQPLWTKSP